MSGFFNTYLGGYASFADDSSHHGHVDTNNINFIGVCVYQSVLNIIIAGNDISHSSSQGLQERSQPLWMNLLS
jgi:hypothetical protein